MEISDDDAETINDVNIMQVLPFEIFNAMSTNEIDFVCARECVHVKCFIKIFSNISFYLK